MHVRLQYSEVSYYFHIQQVANIKCLICEVLQKSLKVWVKCDYFETFHIEMHVHTSNLNTGPSPPLPFLQRLLMTLEGNEMFGCCRSPKDCSVNMLIMHLCSDNHCHYHHVSPMQYVLCQQMFCTSIIMVDLHICSVIHDVLKDSYDIMVSKKVHDNPP